MLPLKNSNAPAAAASASATNEHDEKASEVVDPRLYELQRILQNNEKKLTFIDKKASNLSEKIEKLNKQIDALDSNIFNSEENLTITAVVVGTVALTTSALFPLLIVGDPGLFLALSWGPGCGLGRYLWGKYLDRRRIDFLKKLHPNLLQHFIPQQIKKIYDAIEKIEWKHPDAYKTKITDGYRDEYRYSTRLEYGYSGYRYVRVRESFEVPYTSVKDVGTRNDFEKSAKYVVDEIRKINLDNPNFTIHQMLTDLHKKINNIGSITL